MQISRTDLEKTRDDGIVASPVVLLWSSSSLAEKSLVVATETTRTEKRPPTGVNDLSGRRNSPDGSFATAVFMRSRDVFGGLALLILLLPLIVALAITIMLWDFGPPFFAHVRVGKSGKPFRCYKLRSMHRNSEKRLHQLLNENPDLRREWARSRKLLNDPRVTRLGAFLRSTSLDELPQLFNVLDGTMSLVGPRPIVEEELQMYGRHANCYLRCKPGLTGIWQVTGRSDISYHRRVAADRLYARRRSLAFDWKLLLSTVPAVLGRKGAC